MNSRPRQATIAALAAAALLAFPTAASGSIDYSKNAATGRHAPAEPHDEEIYVNPAAGLDEVVQSNVV